MKERILLVEDDEPIADALAMTLGFDGYVVDTAYNVRDALRLASTQKYDLILSDIMMPDLTGFDLISALRNCEHLNKDTPAIAMTALDGTAKQRILNAGFQFYLAKPFDLCLLKRSVVELVRSP